MVPPSSRLPRVALFCRRAPSQPARQPALSPHLPLASSRALLLQSRAEALVPPPLRRRPRLRFLEALHVPSTLSRPHHACRRLLCRHAHARPLVELLIGLPRRRGLLMRPRAIVS